MTGGRGKQDFGALHEVRSEIAEHERRIEGMIHTGIIVGASYRHGKVRVKIGEIVTDWIPWVVPRAGGNREWQAPEAGEQVLVLCPSGMLENGVALGSLNYVDPDNEEADFRHLAQDPDLHRIIYRKIENDERLFDEHIFWQTYRKAGEEHVWHYLPEKGAYRLEVGENIHFIVGKDDDDEDHIQLRVGKTQLVIKEESIRAHVLEHETELLMEKDRIFSHVNEEAYSEMKADEIVSSVRDGGTVRVEEARVETNIRGVTSHIVENDFVESQVRSSGVHRVEQDRVRSEILGRQVKLELTGSDLQAAVGQSLLKLDQQTARLAGTAADINLSTSASITAPSFSMPKNGGLSAEFVGDSTGAAQPGSFRSGGNATKAKAAQMPYIDDVHTSRERWKVIEGRPPKYPEKRADFQGDPPKVESIEEKNG